MKNASDVLATAATFTAFAGIVGAIGAACMFVATTLVAPALAMIAALAPVA